MFFIDVIFNIAFLKFMNEINVLEKFKCTQ